MPVLIAMLRAVNVGGHSKIKMDELRKLFVDLRLEEPQTYVQSGNIIFRSRESGLVKIAERIQKGIEGRFGCCPDVVLRTPDELRTVVARNPFKGRSGIEPGKLQVVFLLSDAARTARAELSAQNFNPEELHLATRELYIYFPDGMGKSKLPWKRVDKILGTRGTARNWNSVTKMLEIAAKLEAAG
jgi:uncharacterized protein (DUF1697 family)